MSARGFKLDPRSHALHGTTVVFGSGTSSGGGDESKLCPPRRADSRYSPLVLLAQWRITLVVVVVVVFSPKAKVENDGFPESPRADASSRHHLSQNPNLPSFDTTIILTIVRPKYRSATIL